MTEARRYKMVRVVVLSGATTLPDSERTTVLMDEQQARKLQQRGKVRILAETQMHGGPQDVK